MRSMSSAQLCSTTSRRKLPFLVSSPCAWSRARGSTWKETTRSKGARKRFAEATSDERSACSPSAERASGGSAASRGQMSRVLCSR